MGAGLSKERQYAIEYRELHKIRRELVAAGVPARYEKRKVFDTECGYKALFRYKVYFRRLNASNGETALLLSVYLNGDYYGLGSDTKGTAEQGLAKIKELYGKAA